MRVAVRVAAVLGAAALAACTSKSAPSTGALLDEPSSVAVFRGVTTKHGVDPTNPSRPYFPHIAVANAGANDVSIVDGVDDSLVPAPIPLRGLVYPLPGRPALLASGDLGDLKPDLLVAVSAGDSRLQVIRTWAADGAVVGEVDLGADVLALAALAPDPGAPGAVQIVAALAGEQAAVVTFTRVGTSDVIDVAAAQASVSRGALGFQPVHLAVTPGSRTRVWAATPDDLGGGVYGVRAIDVLTPGAAPSPGQVLDAGAPTRLVAAARLATWVAPADPELLGTAGFAGRPVEERVYAALDEGITATGRPGCGLQAPIACGVVALDPATGTLTLDPTPAGTMHAPFAAPIQVGRVLALGASGPPAVAPAADPSFAGTFLRIPTSVGTRVTTGAGAIATVDGSVYVVDLGRWDVPAQQSVVASVKATVTPPVRAPGSSVNQWLVLERTPGVPVPHTDPTGLSTHTVVTAGYTPTDRWTVTNEGVLPSLLTRRAETGDDGGAPWLAMQARVGGTAFEVVRLYDPTLGVHGRDGGTPGDTVVIDATGLGTCTKFEAEIEALRPPDAASFPGGALRLRKKVPTNAAWDACVDALLAPPPSALLRATVRAGGYVLVRGTGEFAVHVGRPVLGELFEVRWQDEVALATACLLPPSVPWPATVPSCPSPGSCRTACEDLQRARLARRVGYLSEAPVALTGPALAFTLALENAALPAPRDLSLVFDTVDGRAPFRVLPTAGSATDPRAILPFDRSPWSAEAGVRFLVPYSSGIVLDLTPTLSGGNPVTVH